MATVEINALVCKNECMQDTNLLQRFCTVVESGTVAEAAELIDMTPGALSRAIQRLETDVGFELFSRQGRNIVVTREGRRLYEKAKRWLESLEAGVREIREGGSAWPVVRLATFEVFSSHVLAWAITQLRPSARFIATEAVPGFIEEAVAGERADFGLTYLPKPRQGVEFQKLARFQFRIFARARAFQGLSVRELPFAAPTTLVGINPAQAGSLDTWPHEIPRVIAHQFELLETALALAQRGGCAIFAPDFVVKACNQLVQSEHRLEVFEGLGKQPKVREQWIYLVKRADAPETREQHRFAKCMRMLCA